MMPGALEAFAIASIRLIMPSATERAIESDQPSPSRHNQDSPPVRPLIVTSPVSRSKSTVAGLDTIRSVPPPTRTDGAFTVSYDNLSGGLWVTYVILSLKVGLRDSP